MVPDHHAGNAGNAHPHMWVDLEAGLFCVMMPALHPSIRNGCSMIFSTALIEEAGLHPDGVGAGIQQQITEIMVNLKPYDYFNVIKRGNDMLPLALVGDVTAGIRENRVWMDFTVSIESNVDLVTQNFSYAIFDPTYYIEIFHREGETIAFDGDALLGVAPRLFNRTSADAIALSQSASLDANQMTPLVAFCGNSTCEMPMSGHGVVAVCTVGLAGLVGLYFWQAPAINFAWSECC